jgi:hypothetical protein
MVWTYVRAGDSVDYYTHAIVLDGIGIGMDKFWDAQQVSW